MADHLVGNAAIFRRAGTRRDHDVRGLLGHQLFNRHLVIAPDFQIGAQFAQVIAVLAAPIVLKRLGAISGVMYMQLATAAALGMLTLGPTGVLAGAVYAGYMAFQYMSEPGMYSLLMEGVEAPERSGASALNFLVIFGGQAVAAAAAGVGVRKFGYPIILSVAAVTALIAGVMFRVLLGRGHRPGIATA